MSTNVFLEIIGLRSFMQADLSREQGLLLKQHKDFAITIPHLTFRGLS